MWWCVVCYGLTCWAGIWQINVQRTKQHYFEAWLFRNAITPNSLVMLRCATVRIVRLLVRVAAFASCYEGYCSDGGALRLMAESPGFLGLVASPDGRVCAYDVFGNVLPTAHESMVALVAACRASGWVKAAWAEEWALLPRVCPRTGAFTLLRSTKAESIGKQFVEVGKQLGFEPLSIGPWCIRKMSCAWVVAGGDAHQAIRLLSQNLGDEGGCMSHVYEPDLSGHDLARHATQRAAAPVYALDCYSLRRVPELAAVRRFGQVPRSSRAYRDWYAGDARIVSAEKALHVVQRVIRSKLGERQGAPVQRALRNVATRLAVVDQVWLGKLERTKKAVVSAKARARYATLRRHQIDVYEAGLERLRGQPFEQGLLATPLQYQELSEDEAIAFGLSRPDLSIARLGLARLPLKVRSLLLDEGLAPLLQVPEQAARTGAVGPAIRLVERTNAIVVRCESESCECEVEWRSTVVEVRCPRCYGCELALGVSSVVAEEVSELLAGEGIRLGVCQATYYDWRDLYPHA